MDVEGEDGASTRGHRHTELSPDALVTNGWMELTLTCAPPEFSTVRTNGVPPPEKVAVAACCNVAVMAIGQFVAMLVTVRVAGVAVVMLPSLVRTMAPTE